MLFYQLLLVVVHEYSEL